VRCLPLLAGKIHALLQKENARPNRYNSYLPSMRLLLVVKFVAAGFSLWSFVDYRAYNVCSDSFKIVHSPMH
jgi:hypothetical protein